MIIVAKLHDMFEFCLFLPQFDPCNEALKQSFYLLLHSLTFLAFCCSLGSHHSSSLSVLGLIQTSGYYGRNNMSLLTVFHCIVIAH